MVSPTLYSHTSGMLSGLRSIIIIRLTQPYRGHQCWVTSSRAYSSVCLVAGYVDYVVEYKYYDLNIGPLVRLTSFDSGEVFDQSCQLKWTFWMCSLDHHMSWEHSRISDDFFPSMDMFGLMVCFFCILMMNISNEYKLLNVSGFILMRTLLANTI